MRDDDYDPQVAEQLTRLWSEDITTEGAIWPTFYVDFSEVMAAVAS